jgi:hypothetical protein
MGIKPAGGGIMADELWRGGLWAAWGFNFWTFCNEYGNAASVIGLVITLVGFFVIWRNQKAIRQAVQREVTRVALAVLRGDLADLDRLLSAAMEACRHAHWTRAYDRCQDARALAIRLRVNLRLLPDEREKIGTGADDLELIASYIDAQKLRTPNPPAAFHEPKRRALDRMILALGEIQSRLESQTWEV